MPILIIVVLAIILAAIILKTVLPPNTIVSKIAGEVLKVAPGVGGLVGIPGLGGGSGSTPTTTAKPPPPPFVPGPTTTGGVSEDPTPPAIKIAVVVLALFLIYSLATLNQKKP